MTLAWKVREGLSQLKYLSPTAKKTLMLTQKEAPQTGGGVWSGHLDTLPASTMAEAKPLPVAPASPMDASSCPGCSISNPARCL